jgi:hypothetical protein
VIKLDINFYDSEKIKKYSNNNVFILLYPQADSWYMIWRINTFRYRAQQQVPYFLRHDLLMYLFWMFATFSLVSISISSQTKTFMDFSVAIFVFDSGDTHLYDL